MQITYNSLNGWMWVLVVEYFLVLSRCAEELVQGGCRPFHCRRVLLTHLMTQILTMHKQLWPFEGEGIHREVTAE